VRPLATARSDQRAPWAALGVICLGIFLIFLDTTTVNVAVPNLIDGIHASFDQVLWILNAYLLTYGVLLLTSGRLGDRFGQRNLFAAGLAVFTLASALCGLSRDGTELIEARVLQGLGAALLTPQCLVILSRIFEPRERGVAMGIFAAVGGLAAMAGAPAGGLIVATWDWRWIFYLNVPVGGAAILLTFLCVPPVRTGGSRRLNLLGVALATGGLLGVLFGLIEGERFGWGSIAGPVTIPSVIGAGLALLVAFAVVEQLRPEPLLPRSLFGNRNLVIMAWLSGAVAFALFGMLLVVIIDLQSALRMSPLQAGLTASPLTISTTLVSPVAGKLSDRVGSRPVLMFGLVLAAAGMIALAVVEGPASTWLDFLLPATVMGVGLGCVFAPLLAEAMRDVPTEMLGSAAGLLTTTRQVGSALGTAVVGAALQNRLVAALHEQAAGAAGAIPGHLRGQFIEAAVGPTRSGLQLGPGQLRAPALPAALSAVDGAQELLRRVLSDSYVAAMRPSLAIPALALLLGAVTCVWIRRTGEVAEAPSLDGIGWAPSALPSGEAI
jgi:EmrB/QacA subfamily drug resistance transporter